MTVEGQMVCSLKIIVGLSHSLYALNILMWNSEMVAFMNPVYTAFLAGAHCPLGYTYTFPPSLSPHPSNLLSLLIFYLFKRMN